MTNSPAADPAITAGNPLPGAGAGQWQMLSPQARALFLGCGALVALPAAIAARLLTRVFELPFGWAAAGAAAVLGGGIGAWFGLRRYRYTLWRLDQDAFSVRKGRLWQSDIRVPRNRVQHLDLRRGPVERSFGLASLVIHTAGTRDSSVSISGLVQADAERLRDVLARQSEHDHPDADNVAASHDPGATPSPP